MIESMFGNTTNKRATVIIDKKPAAHTLSVYSFENLLIGNSIFMLTFKLHMSTLTEKPAQKIRIGRDVDQRWA